jgi:hypothetical protein
VSEKEFAIKIRRLLLAIVALIEQRYGLGIYAAPEMVEVMETDSVT